MEEVKTPKINQGLGIAGFVLAIIAILTAFIPVVGIGAIVPAVLAIVFTSIAISKSLKTDHLRGLIIAGLIISIVAFFISVSQIYIGVKLNSLGKRTDKIEAFSKELQKGLDDEFSDKEMEELEKVMDDLEGQIEKISDENAEEIGRAAGKALKEFTKEIKKAKEELKDSTNKE